MSTWLLRRVAASLAIVFAVVTLTFVLVHLAPGKPFLPGAETPIDPEVVAHLDTLYGLHQRIPVQYAKYLAALARGQMGQSFALHRPVADALADAIPNTLALTGVALAIDLLLGLALGVYQAVRARRLPDAALGYATLFLNSVPTFWLGLLVLLVFGEWLHWFPVGGVVDPVLHSSLSVGGPGGRPALAPRAPRAHAGVRRRRRHRALSARRGPRGHRAGLRAHRARQGPARAPGGAGPRAPQRTAAARHVVRPVVPVPVDRVRCWWKRCSRGRGWGSWRRTPSSGAIIRW